MSLSSVLYNMGHFGNITHRDSVFKWLFRKKSIMKTNVQCMLQMAYKDNMKAHETARDQLISEWYRQCTW